MLVPVDPSHVVGPLAGGAALCFIGALFATGSRLAHRFPGVRRKDNPSREHVRHRCCYCRWGQARLVQEKVSREDRDIVEVRFFACKSCGLPHWTVRRVPITELARW